MEGKQTKKKNRGHRQEIQFIADNTKKLTRQELHTMIRELLTEILAVKVWEIMDRDQRIINALRDVFLRFMKTSDFKYIIERALYDERREARRIVEDVVLETLTATKKKKKTTDKPVGTPRTRRVKL